jgi:hypothetical protein
MANASAIPLINAALTRTGNEAITDLSDGSAGGTIAAQNYDELVDGLLGSHPWKWASRTATLNLISGTVDLPWLYAYERPSDMLELRVVEVSGIPIQYEVRSDQIYTNFGSDAEVIAKYTWRPTEPFWPKWFRLAVIAALEPMFLRGIGERHQEAAERDKAAFRMLAIAKNRDSQQQSARPVMTSPMLQARVGATVFDPRWPSWPRF